MLSSAADSAFGSLDEAKGKFNAAAAGRFGSGWAWMSVDADGKLVISSTPNQVSLHLDQLTPLWLRTDVKES